MRQLVHSVGLSCNILIRKYIDPKNNPDWKPEDEDGLSESTKRIYRRHQEWWRQEYGMAQLRDFTENILRDVRNEFVNEPTSGNAKIDRFKAIWNWIREFSTAVKLPDVCPATKITRLETLNEAHLVWPQAVITKFVEDRNRLLTMYYLARYSGQRLGDRRNMQCSDFNDEGNRIYVVQEKNRHENLDTNPQDARRAPALAARQSQEQRFFSHQHAR